MQISNRRNLSLTAGSNSERWSCEAKEATIFVVYLPDIQLSLGHLFPQILIFILQGFCFGFQILEESTNNANVR